MYKNNSKNNNIFIYGKHPVFVSLALQKRIFYQIFITKNNQTILLDFLQQKQLNKLMNLVKIVDNKFFDNRLGDACVHQGIAVEASKITMQSQFDLLQQLHQNKNNLPNILLLDQLSDPQNIGAIIRSAVAFDVVNIVFSKHNSCLENNTIIKASAGNIEFANLIEATNFNDLLHKLKELGYWCAGLSAKGTSNLAELKKYQPLAMVIGSEGFGIRHLVAKNCDLLVNIRTNSQVESLNASVATAILLHSLKNY
jgi:23S rRNA (guanosine2251-2'-O)-methyltransferase